MKKRWSILLTLTMAASLCSIHGEVSAAEAKIITYQAAPAQISQGEKVSFKVTTTEDTEYIAVFDEAGNMLRTWDAEQYSAMEDENRMWYVILPVEEEGTPYFTFGASSDNETFEQESRIPVTVVNEAPVISSTGVPDASNVMTTAKGFVDSYENVLFNVSTADNAKYLTMFDKEGQPLETWTAEENGVLGTNGKMFWMFRYRPVGSGMMEYRFKASEDGVNYGKDTFTFIQVNPVDLSDQTEYLGDWYGLSRTVDGTPVDLLEENITLQLTLNSDGTGEVKEGEAVSEAEWHKERGKVKLDGEPAEILEDGTLKAALYGTETIFSRRDPFAPMEMPYDPLPGEDFWYDTDYARLDEYQGYELNLYLPREIDGNELTVVGGSMMGRASRGDNYEVELPVRSLVIPENYTEIPYWAFSGCETLETVICYAPLETLQDGVFNGCTSLREVVFVNGVNNIGSSVFDGCGSLETVYLGRNVQNVNEYAFNGSNLTLEQCITNPAEMPDVDALLAAVKSDPMPTPEPASAEPVGEEGEPFFGSWKAESMEMDGETYNVAEMGMNSVMTLKEDGTCIMDDGDSMEEMIWSVTDGAAMLDTMTLSIMEDGKLCMEEDGMKMFFIRTEAAGSTDAQNVASTEEPEEDPEPETETDAEAYADYFGIWYGITMLDGDEEYDLASLGLDLSVEIREDGTAVLDMAGEKDKAVWSVGTGGIQIEDMELSLQEDGTLKMNQDGTEMIFGKEKPEAQAPSQEDLEAYADYFGTWYCHSMAYGDDVIDLTQEEDGMSIEISEDGSALMTADGEEQNLRWKAAENGIEVSMLTLVLQEDGTLKAEDEGMTLIFGREKPEPVKVPKPTEEPEPTETPMPKPTETPTPEPTETPTPEPTEEPEPTETPASDPMKAMPLEERMDKKFVCIGADVSGLTVDRSMLGGDYEMTFYEDGLMTFKLAGMELPGKLKWEQKTVEEKGESKEAFAIDYYGKELIAVCTEKGFDLNYFDTMLMHFELLKEE